jgi:hypothetical protein
MSKIPPRSRMEAEPPRQPSHPPKKPLDPLVITALTMTIGLIVITVVGMILTAPDRSIPPYSVIAQIGETVSVNVPPNTTDAQIEALLFRFRAAGEGHRDTFRRLKIKPTTPGTPQGSYQRLTIYVLGDVGLSEESVLKDYLAGEHSARGAFMRAVRGVYRLTPDREFGALGYVGEETMAGENTGQRILFQGTAGGG